MSAFLFLLVKLNLAMGMAIVLVALLRRLLRVSFGAPIAYAIWFLVPIAGIASLLPPRVAAPAAVALVHVPAAPSPVMVHIPQSVLRVTEQLTNPSAGQGAAAIIAVPMPTSAYQDPALLLLAAWALGTVLMTLYLVRLQLRFSAAMRRGEAGPAVLGFFRPRIVTPDSFLTHFTPQEQAAILAHERIHLARQDARINAAAALLRCLCWFNPLIHLGARWLRIDQELACDATAVAGAISRRDYAEALLKSQLVVTALPLGCNWPGSQHPLVERIALLKRKPPGGARRLAGLSLIMLTSGFAGLGAWAAQPPVVAATAPLSHMAALPAPNATSREVPVAAPDQTAPNQTAPNQAAETPAVHATSTSSGGEIDAARNVPAESAVSPAPARVQMPSTARIAAQMVSAVAEVPSISPALNAAIGLDLRSLQQDGGSPNSSIRGAPKTFPTLSDTDAFVVATTPSGVGDPEVTVCRLPQRFAGSDRVGPEVCGHNWQWLTMALNAKELAADGKTLIDKPTVANPTGEGDPDAMTCRTPKSAMRAPVCETNRFWANLIKNHQTIDKPTVDNPTGEGDPDGVTCRTPKFVWRGPLVEVCRTNRFWADVVKNHQWVDAYGVISGRPPMPRYTAFGGIPNSTGDIFSYNGYGSYPGHDSGQAWQSSEPNGGGQFSGNGGNSTPTFHGYGGGISPGGGGTSGSGGGGWGGGGTPTMGGYHP